MKKNFMKTSVIIVLMFLSALFAQINAQPGYAGEWLKTRIYGHTYESGGFSTAQYNWIRDHHELFCFEKTHLRAVYGNPSHEYTSMLDAAVLVDNNPRCKPITIYSIGGDYHEWFESEAEIYVTNPELFIWSGGESVSLNINANGFEDWYVETTNNLVDNSELEGIFIDGVEGNYIDGNGDEAKAIFDRMHGISIMNGFNPDPNNPGTLRAGPDYLDHCAGVFVDSWFRRNCDTKEIARTLVDACIAIPANKILILFCGNNNDGIWGTDHTFSHAGYLIVANENTYYRWTGDGLWEPASMMEYHSDFDKEMGAPLGKATKNGYAYTRVFEHCTVTLNLDNKTSNIEWGQNNGGSSSGGSSSGGSSSGGSSSGGNLALSGSANQSSTDYSGVPSRAIDGNTNGAWSGGSVTHTAAAANQWWQVVLSSEANIGDIVIYNRTDACCMDRLSDFRLTVSDNSNDIVYTRNVTSYPNPSSTFNAGGVSGRTIRITSNLSVALSLAEVQVYEGSSSSGGSSSGGSSSGGSSSGGSSSGGNIALGGTAAQSSTDYSGAASRAIDGNTNGAWSGGSVTHTAAEDGAWWTLNFGSEYSIDEIIIYNRTDACCMDRLSDFVVYMWNASGTRTLRRYITTTPNPSVTIDAGGVLGNSMRIKSNLTATALSLAEVEVYGSSKSAKVATEITGKNFGIYPNPVSDVLTIEINGSQTARVDIINNAGQAIVSRNIKAGSGNIDVSGLPSGIYIVKVADGQNVQTKKIIKK